MTQNSFRDLIRFRAYFIHCEARGEEHGRWAGGGRGRWEGGGRSKGGRRGETREMGGVRNERGERSECYRLLTL